MSCVCVCVCLGELVTKQPLIAGMRTVKKETLKLISCWVSKSQDPGMVSIDACMHYNIIHNHLA